MNKEQVNLSTHKTTPGAPPIGRRRRRAHGRTVAAAITAARTPRVARVPARRRASRAKPPPRAACLRACSRRRRCGDREGASSPGARTSFGAALIAAGSGCFGHRCLGSPPPLGWQSLPRSPRNCSRATSSRLLLSHCLLATPQPAALTLPLQPALALPPRNCSLLPSLCAAPCLTNPLLALGDSVPSAGSGGRAPKNFRRNRFTMLCSADGMSLAYDRLMLATLGSLI